MSGVLHAICEAVPTVLALRHDFFLVSGKTLLTQVRKCPILAASRINPRGWVCIWDFRDDENPADREAEGRWHGCERLASDLT